MTSEKTSLRPHMPALDGFRGLAVLLVMLSHFLVMGGLLDGEAPHQRLLRGGYVGVDMFFVLSGFLITGILLDAKGTPQYFRTFYMRRVLRIFPLYYFALALAFLSVPLLTPHDAHRLQGLHSPAWHWLYASNIGIALRGTWLESPTWLNLGHFWSLAVEEQFYLVWPFLVYFLSRKSLARLTLACIALAPVFEHLLNAKTQSTLTGYVSTPARLNTLGIGAWLALAIRDEELWPRVQRWAPKALLFSALATLGGFLIKGFPLFPTACTFFFGAALVVALKSDDTLWTLALNHPVLRFLGKYSYGLYVYHHLLRPVWERFIWKGLVTPLLGHGWLAVIGYTLVAGAATVVLSLLSWWLLEQPILRLKRHFEYKKASAQSEPREQTLAAEPS